MQDINAQGKSARGQASFAYKYKQYATQTPLRHRSPRRIEATNHLINEQIDPLSFVSAPPSPRDPTTSATLPSFLQYQPSPTYMHCLHEAHRETPSQARTRSMQQGHAVILTASSAVVLTCIQEKH